jgi:long-chain acyl-CoA synthetase
MQLQALICFYGFYIGMLHLINKRISSKKNFKKLCLNHYCISSRGVVRKDSLWDSLVFRKVQESLGGRCRLISTGSAPISARVLNFIRVATGAVVSRTNFILKHLFL